MRDVELLIPASNLEVLKVAVLYGADAVYIGGEMYGLRAKAKNFSMEDVKAGIEFAHKHGVKVYITAKISVLISQMIWKSNHLFTEQCVFPILEDVC